MLALFKTWLLCLLVLASNAAVPENEDISGKQSGGDLSQNENVSKIMADLFKTCKIINNVSMACFLCSLLCSIFFFCFFLLFFSSIFFSSIFFYFFLLFFSSISLCLLASKLFSLLLFVLLLTNSGLGVDCESLGGGAHAVSGRELALRTELQRLLVRRLPHGRPD
jgi:hypothetical protein